MNRKYKTKVENIAKIQNLYGKTKTKSNRIFSNCYEELEYLW